MKRRRIDYSEAEQEAVAELMQLELARRGLSRKELVPLSGLSTSTVDKALAGRFSPLTLARLEQVFGVQFDPDGNLPVGQPAPPASQPAPSTARPIAPYAATAPGEARAAAELGGYSRAEYAHLIGSYVTARPAWKDRARIMCYCTEIAWDEQQACLVFAEKHKPDARNSHQGRLAIPNGASFIYWLSIGQGWVRSVTSWKPADDGEMCGIISTLHNPVANMLVPAAAPIIFVKRADMAGMVFGELGPGEGEQADYRRRLRLAMERGNVMWTTP